MCLCYEVLRGVLCCCVVVWCVVWCFGLCCVVLGLCWLVLCCVEFVARCRFVGVGVGVESFLLLVPMYVVVLRCGVLCCVLLVLCCGCVA